MRVKVKLANEATHILEVADLKFKIGDRLTLIDMYMPQDSNISLLRIGVKEKKANEVYEDLCSNSYVDLEKYAMHIEYIKHYYRLNYISLEDYGRLLESEAEYTDLDTLMLELAGCTETEWAAQRAEEASDELEPVDGGFEQETVAGVTQETRIEPK